MTPEKDSETTVETPTIEIPEIEIKKTEELITPPDKVCYSNNGLSMRHVAPDYEAQDGDLLFDELLDETALGNAFAGYARAAGDAQIKTHIMQLEATITNRRICEAILGTDGGWLENVRTEIATLRAEL